jgi:hypothetical protein
VGQTAPPEFGLGVLKFRRHLLKKKSLEKERPKIRITPEERPKKKLEEEAAN